MHKNNSIISICLAFLILVGISTALYAENIDKANDAVTNGKAEVKDPKKNDDKTNSKNQDNNSISDFVNGFFEFIVRYSSDMSMARVVKSQDPFYKDITMREKGDPDLPIIRADVNYQRINSSIHAYDTRIEVGYGPIGYQYRQTHYVDKNPNERNDFVQFHGLFRISGSNVFEADAGAGGVILRGNNEHSGLSLTFPINIYPTPHLGIRLVPTWNWIKNNVVSDYDGSISYHRKYFSVQAGFRRSQTEGELLQGPYAGFSLHY